VSRINGSPGNKRKHRKMENIQRFGVTRRWSDIVIHGGTAYFVEVADDPTQDVRGQIAQILSQIDGRLAVFGRDRTSLLQVLIYLSDLADGVALNEQWEKWIPEGHAPARACVQAGLSPGYCVEMVVTAASGV
jgi:enamine deaminase RidA (YjgF/YER057c/UK114 family)